MALYLDASVLVALVRNEPTRPLLAALLAPGEYASCVSDLAIAEAAAALAARGRGVNRLPEMIVNDFARLDDWAAAFAEAVTVVAGDTASANRFVRRPDIALRAPDAVHIAAAHRLGATLLTLDKAMARAAAKLGVPYLNPAEAVVPGEPKD